MKSVSFLRGSWKKKDETKTPKILTYGDTARSGSLTFLRSSSIPLDPLYEEWDTNGISHSEMSPQPRFSSTQQPLGIESLPEGRRGYLSPQRDYDARNRQIFALHDRRRSSSDFADPSHPFSAPSARSTPVPQRPFKTKSQSLPVAASNSNHFPLSRSVKIQRSAPNLNHGRDGSVEEPSVPSDAEIHGWICGKQSPHVQTPPGSKALLPRDSSIDSIHMQGLIADAEQTYPDTQKPCAGLRITTKIDTSVSSLPYLHSPSSMQSCSTSEDADPSSPTSVSSSDLDESTLALFPAPPSMTPPISPPTVQNYYLLPTPQTSPASDRTPTNLKFPMVPLRNSRTSPTVIRKSASYGRLHPLPTPPVTPHLGVFDYQSGLRPALRAASSTSNLRVAPSRNRTNMHRSTSSDLSSEHSSYSEHSDARIQLFSRPGPPNYCSSLSTPSENVVSI